MLSFYALPSVLAITLKLVVAWHFRRSINDTNPNLLILFIAFLGANICEFICFFFVSDPNAGFAFLIGYYIFMLAASLALVALSLDITDRCTGLWRAILVSVFAAVTTFLVTPDTAILEAKSIGYSITRVPGPYYFVLQIAMILCLTTGVGVLVLTMTRSNSKTHRRDAKILLLAFTPFFSVGAFVVLLMAMGANINAAVIMSMAITVTLWILFFTTDEEKKFVFMSHIPMSREHDLVRKTANFLASPELSVDAATAYLEKEMIANALSATNQNKTRAAQMLGLSRQTLQRRLKEHEIDDS